MTVNVLDDGATLELGETGPAGDRRYRWELAAADGTVLEHGPWHPHPGPALRQGATPGGRAASKTTADSLFADPEPVDVETALL